MLESDALARLLTSGDLVMARKSRGRDRAFTGLGLVPRACADVRKLLLDPSKYPAIYPMVVEARVLRQGQDFVTFELEADVGATTTETRVTMRSHPDGRLTTWQEAGSSAWHFFDRGASTCLTHYTHDEEHSRGSVVLRMTFSGKEALKHGVQAASAAGNVKNVREYLEAGARLRTAHRADRVARDLSQLAVYGTIAYLPRSKNQAVQVAARAGQRADVALDAAQASELWRDSMPLFYGEIVAARVDGRRRMHYTLTSMFEELEFDTWQRRGEQRIDEHVIEGELKTGGWTWHVIQGGSGVALVLTMRIDVAEGDWVVKRLAGSNSAAGDGTNLGIAFMLVEGVASAAREGASAPRALDGAASPGTK